MLPSMIESSSIKANRDLHSIEVYSICRVAHQFEYDQVSLCKPPSPPDVGFSNCIFEFLLSTINKRCKEIIGCIMPSFDRTSNCSYGWFAYWSQCIFDWSSFCTPLVDSRKHINLSVVTKSDISL